MAEWFEFGENHRHSSYDFRRKKNKKFFIAIAVIVLIAFVMASDFGGIRTTIEEKSSKILPAKKDYIIIGTGSPCLDLEGLEHNLCQITCSPLAYGDKYKCLDYEIACYCIKTPITETSVLKNDYCKENIIPETLTFEYDFNEKSDSLSTLISGWKDGTEILVEDYYTDGFHKPYGLTYPICRKGSEKGENTNYFYCENFIYRKTNIGEDGNIGETITYKMNLVLDKNSIITSKIDNFRNHASFEVVSSTCKSF